MEKYHERSSFNVLLQNEIHSLVVKIDCNMYLNGAVLQAFIPGLLSCDVTRTR